MLYSLKIIEHQNAVRIRNAMKTTKLHIAERPFFSFAQMKLSKTDRCRYCRIGIGGNFSWSSIAVLVWKMAIGPTITAVDKINYFLVDCNN